ncbi:MAG: energy transducer TonB [Bacteroidia bacterium]
MKNKIILVTILLLFVIYGHAQDTIPVADTNKVLPEFRGGDVAYNKYSVKQVKYPQEAKEKAHQGTVIVAFTVEADGSITHVHAVKEVEGAPELTVEAIRFISAMPLWQPGTINGKPTSMESAKGLHFRLQ